MLIAGGKLVDAAETGTPAACTKVPAAEKIVYGHWLLPKEVLDCSDDLIQKMMLFAGRRADRCCGDRNTCSLLKTGCR